MQMLIIGKSLCRQAWSILCAVSVCLPAVGQKIVLRTYMAMTDDKVCFLHIQCIGANPSTWNLVKRLSWSNTKVFPLQGLYTAVTAMTSRLLVGGKE